MLFVYCLYLYYDFVLIKVASQNQCPTSDYKAPHVLLRIDFTAEFSKVFSYFHKTSKQLLQKFSQLPELEYHKYNLEM